MFSCWCCSITVTNAFLTYSLTTTLFVNRHLYLNIMYIYCGPDRRNNLPVGVSDWFTESIDARFNVLPSLYFQMTFCVITLCLWIMIIISVFVLCTCITVSDFILLRNRVYHVDRTDFRYWRSCVSKILLHVTHHAALPMQPQQRHFYI